MPHAFIHINHDNSINFITLKQEAPDFENIRIVEQEVTDEELNNYGSLAYKDGKLVPLLEGIVLPAEE